jgi:hypothetical protein
MSQDLAENPLATREDVALALSALSAPLLRSLGDPGPGPLPGFNAGRRSDQCARIETLARPLWGLAPLAAGGGHIEGIEALGRAIAQGFDPAHARYWGEPRDHDQRVAELAAVAFAIRAAPATFLDPMPAPARSNLAAWIGRASARELPDNNWLLFRVLSLLAAERLGARLDTARIAADLDRIEQFDAGGGWYSDGPTEQRDHYVAFALHFYALLYAAFEETRDAARAARLRERASRFARDYAAWFDSEGAALPIGRSLSYRFAHAAFWGALAFSGVEALPWGEVKGLWLRNLRWWLRRPIVDAAGWLTAGYAYPNPAISEDYMSPGSPYWAFKAFLPLALAPTHPFWMAKESAQPELSTTLAQPPARLLVCRAEQGRHVFALCAGQWASWRPRHDAAKYAKLCYSTRYGFSVGSAPTGLEAGAFDSTLALTDDGVHFRVRRATTAHESGERHVASSWEPWPDVAVRTWLIAAPPWHLRAHRIRASRAISAVEGGFAIPCDGVDRLSTDGWIGQERRAFAVTEGGACEIVDLAGARSGIVVIAEPGTNLIAPRTAIPSLAGPIPAGESWLVCAVSADACEPAGAMPFTVSATQSGWRVEAPGYAIELGEALAG